MKANIENFLAKFPTNAQTWHYATDEVRDLARATRELLEDLEDVIIEPVDFQAIRTPAEWNTKGRAYILANFDRMQPATKTAFYNRFREWFK